MIKKKQEPIVCQICSKKQELRDAIPAGIVREPLAALIKKEYPNWSSEGFICKSDLNRFRAQYVREVLETNKGELSTLEQQVVSSIKEQDLVSKNVNVESEQKLSLGDRTSDRIADFAGSWIFIISFFCVLFLWIGVNSLLLIWRPFDPYPFILLNLVLSCLAAIQAPVILMSQNRQETRDRIRAEHDYVVNLKAELEIRHLHEKLDHLLMNQWQRLLEIQQIQTDLMEELTKSK
ncbi:MAG: DUF1003 domain-containing protein [bacterium]